MKIVILAGGIGQRLWPLSHSTSPKQIRPFFGKETLLQKTVGRLKKGFSVSDLYVVTGKKFARQIYAQLPGFPKNHVLLEPARKNTAAAIGLAAYTLARKNPREIMISVASDHYIKEEGRFLADLKALGRVIKKNPRAVCLMGIRPTYPETGYGYIQLGGRVKFVPGLRLFKIRRFIEKPPLKLATKLAAYKNYLWNPSYFAWRVDRLTELYSQFTPQTHKLLLETVYGRPAAFQKIEPEAIDYAVMEKLHQDFYVLPANFSWADVGHWASVREIQAKKSSENITLGLQHVLKTSGSLIYNYTDKVLTAVGVKDLLIVQTEQGTLVCHKDSAQDVKTLVEQMQKHKDLMRFV
jgi:mannose-1-phosphate guanylyltransferase